MLVTKVLEDAVGIQWQGLVDKSTSSQANNGIGVPLIVGHFKRGRIDKPMQITQGNIRAMLGYDFKNQDYKAVQHYLSSGLPYVNVLRTIKFNTQTLEPEVAEPEVNYPSIMIFYAFYIVNRKIDNMVIEVNNDGVVETKTISDFFISDTYFEPIVVNGVDIFHYACSEHLSFRNQKSSKSNIKITFNLEQGYTPSDDFIRYELFSPEYKDIDIPEFLDSAKQYNPSITYNNNGNSIVMTFTLGGKPNS